MPEDFMGSLHFNMSYEDKIIYECVATGKPTTVLHHLITRGSRPDLVDAEFNLMPLCQEAHNQIHLWGNMHFFERYPSALKYVKKKGWYWDSVLHKYWHREATKGF